MKRIVVKNKIEEAYKIQEDNTSYKEFSLKEVVETVDKIPEEIFEIIGEIVSFLDTNEEVIQGGIGNED